ncbi:hypothetical protein D3C87_1968720 [compost metagenome]
MGAAARSELLELARKFRYREPWPLSRRLRRGSRLLWSAGTLSSANGYYDRGNGSFSYGIVAGAVDD